MIGIEAVSAFGASATPAVVTQLGATAPTAAAATGELSFAQLLSQGLQQVDSRVANANDLVRQFALDDSVPLHQVTYALEEARLAVELAMQVRGRLVESYRELMNMQL